MRDLNELTLTLQLFREGKKYVSYNTEFDVSSCGDTPEIARKNLRDAVAGFIKSAHKMGTLDEILEQAGFVHKGNSWITPELVALDRFSLAV